MPGLSTTLRLALSLTAPVAPPRQPVAPSQADPPKTLLELALPVPFFA